MAFNLTTPISVDMYLVSIEGERGEAEESRIGLLVVAEVLR